MKISRSLQQNMHHNLSKRNANFGLSFCIVNLNWIYYKVLSS
jgi:hypothetical protein